MKILFISDIHGISKNLDLLKKVIEENEFAKIVNLGDIYHCGLSVRGFLEVNPNAVKDFLTNYKDKLITVRGNCDSDVDVKVSEFPICSELTLIDVDGINIYCTHGNIYNNVNNLIFNDCDVLIYGHFHIPYIEKKDNITYACVGSISLPRDENGPTYAVYENRKITIYSLLNNSVIFESEV